jgi:hypothetical protein
MDGLKINSIENLSGLKSSEGISLEATLANRSALAFWSLGIDEILNAMKCQSDLVLKIDSVSNDLIGNVWCYVPV